ncbi:MAG: amidase family protein [Anaerolineaceae bacterium]
MNLLELTIETFHQALRSNQITSEQLVRFYLDRIQRFDSKLSSIICLNPTALTQAKRLDDYFLTTRELIGPLHGVPVLLKDNIETEEMPTTAGSLSLAGFCSGKDAELVRRLKEAGAIILAKTNLHEFAIWGESISSIKGQTRNPYDLTRTPGGSSGGTGAALAANFGLVGIGTDTINSIRSPSSACNLVGIRPTMGIVSNDGIVPYSHTQDTAGPMARTVADAAIVLGVISTLNTETPSVRSPRSGHWRIGILKSFFGQLPINEEVNRVMSEALAQFDDLGIELIEIDENIDLSDLLNNISVHLFDLVHDLDAYLRQVGTPMKSVDDILASGLYHSGIRENLLNARTLSINSTGYSDRLNRRKALQVQVRNILESKNLDALIFPHQQQLVCKVGASQLQRNGALAAITGFPSICVPAGFSQVTSDAPIGVPIGFELVDLPYNEPNLIEIVALYEQNCPKRQRPLEELWL